MTDPKKQLTISDLSKGDIRIDEVVDIFVADYENKLHARKEQLQKSIKAAKEGIDEFVKKVEDGCKADSNKYAFENVQFDLKAHFRSVDISFGDGKVVYNYTITNVAGKKDGNYMSRDFVEDLDVNLCDQYRQMKKALADEQSDLQEVMGFISNIDRKVRQIKGELGRKRLEEVGLGELMTDANLQRLIELK